MVGLPLAPFFTWDVPSHSGRASCAPDPAIDSALTSTFSIFKPPPQPHIMNSITPRLMRSSRVIHQVLAAKPAAGGYGRIATAAGGYGRLGGYGKATGGYGARAFTQGKQLKREEKEGNHPTPEFDVEGRGESKLYSFEDVCLISFRYSSCHCGWVYLY